MTELDEGLSRVSERTSIRPSDLRGVPGRPLTRSPHR